MTFRFFPPGYLLGVLFCLVSIADETDCALETASAAIPVARTVRRLGRAGGPSSQSQVKFSSARYEEGAAPPVLPELAKSGFIYDVTASLDPIGPHDYKPSLYGNSVVGDSIRRYLPVKNFEDGTLDVFVACNSWDPDPAIDRGKIYAAVLNFGARGREVRGMKFNDEAKRNVRIFIVGSKDQLGNEVPVEMVALAEEIHAEFGVPVAVNNRFARIIDSGDFEIPGEHPWVIFD